MDPSEQWALTWDDLQEIYQECEKAGFGVGSFGRFVETGTFLGQTVVALSAHFSELHSIELSRECFEAAKLFAWKAQRPIHFHQGHSTKVLQAILPKLNGPTVFYLDAHFSGSVTAGLEEKVPLPEELLLISELFPHAALVIIDDLDLFAQVNTFEAIDGQTGAFSGRHPSDWRSITCEALERSSSFRCFGSFKAKNRFILQLRADGKGGIDSGQDRSSQFNAAFSSVGAVCPDLVHRQMDAQHPDREKHWVSFPGLRLQSEVLERVRSQGQWWRQIVSAIEKESSNHLGKASANYKELQEQMTAERTKTAKLCEKSVEKKMTRKECIALHDDLLEAYMNKDFQDKIKAAWAAADGNNAKQQKAKRQLCLPLQLPIMAKYGFEASEKGVFACLWAVRTTFFNFKRPEEFDRELTLRAALLDFLVSPGHSLHPEVAQWAVQHYAATPGAGAVWKMRKVQT
ncbi:unnamed protein product [Durusdinium trenchii]|uniref:Protein C10 n=1 Tax=Durusdinium trenchii TaxID=1381693 RepID=A0ABP0PRB8_9DINO